MKIGAGGTQGLTPKTGRWGLEARGGPVSGVADICAVAGEGTQSNGACHAEGSARPPCQPGTAVTVPGTQHALM